MDLYLEIKCLKKENQQQKEFIHPLLTKVASLEERFSRYENPKNSRNSSVPLSHNYSRPPKTRSLRGPSDKKAGGQPGHVGTTLEMVEKPDEVIEHIPAFCTCCRCNISQLQAELVESRQEVVLPVIEPVYVEHQIFKRTCPCGHTIVGDFPAGITPGISYGENVENLSAYLSARQFVPFHHLAEMFCSALLPPLLESPPKIITFAINKKTDIILWNFLTKCITTTAFSHISLPPVYLYC